MIVQWIYTSNISVIDVGMEDAMAAGAWPEKENPNTTRINEIIDYVKQVTPFRTGADRVTVDRF